MFIFSLFLPRLHYFKYKTIMTVADISHIPIIDFSLFKSDPQKCGKLILDAAQNVGFFYLRNFGFTRDEVEDMFLLVHNIIYFLFFFLFLLLLSTYAIESSTKAFIYVLSPKIFLTHPRKKSQNMLLTKQILGTLLYDKKRKIIFYLSLSY